MRISFKTQITILITIFIIIIAGLFYLNFSNQGEDIYITSALEEFNNANVIAYQWSENASLLSTRYRSNFLGLSDNYAWSFRYWNNSDDDNNLLVIAISTNGTIYIEHSTRLSHEHFLINNWTIDSITAYEIAKNITIIKSFLDNNPILESFSLHTPAEGANSVWSIDWVYDAGNDNPKWAHIEIDATTGEVLYVQAD